MEIELEQREQEEWRALMDEEDSREKDETKDDDEEEEKGQGGESKVSSSSSSSSPSPPSESKISDAAAPCGVWLVADKVGVYYRNTRSNSDKNKDIPYAAAGELLRPVAVDGNWLALRVKEIGVMFIPIHVDDHDHDLVVLQSEPVKSKREESKGEEEEQGNIAPDLWHDDFHYLHLDGVTEVVTIPFQRDMKEIPQVVQVMAEVAKVEKEAEPHKSLMLANECWDGVTVEWWMKPDISCRSSTIHELQQMNIVGWGDQIKGRNHIRLIGDDLVVSLTTTTNSVGDVVSGVVSGDAGSVRSGEESKSGGNELVHKSTVTTTECVVPLVRMKFGKSTTMPFIDDNGPVWIKDDFATFGDSDWSTLTGRTKARSGIFKYKSGWSKDYISSSTSEVQEKMVHTGHYQCDQHGYENLFYLYSFFFSYFSFFSSPSNFLS